MSDIEIVLASTSSPSHDAGSSRCDLHHRPPNVDEDLMKDVLTRSGANGSRMPLHWPK
jgi:hypothetical protein